MQRISWRVKLFIFFGLVALIPLGISGWNMIGIADDEFKSSTNSELSSVVGQISSQINNSFTNQWMQPLFLLKTTLEGQTLGLSEKLALVEATTKDVKELLCIQVFVKTGTDSYQLAFQTAKDSIKANKEAANINSTVFLQPNGVKEFDKNVIIKQAPAYQPSIQRWTMRIAMPMHIGNISAIVTALVDLNSLSAYLEGHYYAKTGNIYILDHNGRVLFRKDSPALSDLEVVRNVTEQLKSGNRSLGTNSYKSPEGDKIISCFSFPENLDWAVIAEIKEAKAYEPVFKIRKTLMLWLLFGIGVAVLGGFLFSNDISKPIISLAKEAAKVAKGNFDISAGYKGKDAIGVLGTTLESMGQSLKASFAQIAEQNRLLEEYNRTLEIKVEERTVQLKEKNEALEDTLTKLKETQDQLVMQQKLASLGQLTAGIAHEIKNPLNFVNNFAKLSVGLVDEIKEELERCKDNTAEIDMGYVDEILGDIQTNVKKIAEHGTRADNIVKNMLEHSRSDKGEYTKTDINKLLDESIHLSYHGTKTQDIEFNCILEFNLDKSIAPVNLNAQALSQVFINLSNNSFYALKKKSIGNPGYEPKFSVTSKDTNTFIEITFRDNGTGMPEEVVKKVFEPFYTTKPTGEGTGLGLSLSFDIVNQMHRGEMAVKSEDGKYTEFTIKLAKNLTSV